MPSLVTAAAALRESLLAFEPAHHSGADCASIVEALAATEKACAAARLRAAARAADCGAHRQRGFLDAADWLARTSGSSAREARAALETARRLDDCPRTSAALQRGELSLAQAQEITRTEKEQPGSEADLVRLAHNESLGTLKERARQRRHEGIDPEVLYGRQRRARDFHHFVDDLGLVQIRGGLLPAIGVPLCNRIDAETDRLRRRAKQEGRDEPRGAHAHDAFAALLTGKANGRARGADCVVVVDVRAYRRGHAHPDEPCHIVGAGSIPVALAKEMAKDAFVKAVLHDGVQIHTVAHLGRHIPAGLRTALELGSPPDFAGVTCVEAGCGRRHGLEWDHVDPVANDGPTSYVNLKPRCWPHHQEKTKQDRRAGVLDGAIARLKRAPP